MPADPGAPGKRKKSAKMSGYWAWQQEKGGEVRGRSEDTPQGWLSSHSQPAARLVEQPFAARGLPAARPRHRHQATTRPAGSLPASASLE